MNRPPAPSQSLFTDGWSLDHINAATAGSKVLIERTDAPEIPQPFERAPGVLARCETVRSGVRTQCHARSRVCRMASGL